MSARPFVPATVGDVVMTPTNNEGTVVEVFGARECDEVAVQHSGAGLGTGPYLVRWRHSQLIVRPAWRRADYRRGEGR